MSRACQQIAHVSGLRQGMDSTRSLRATRSGVWIAVVTNLLAAVLAARIAARMQQLPSDDPPRASARRA